jgi:hypothetical protein
MSDLRKTEASLPSNKSASKPLPEPSTDFTAVSTSLGVEYVSVSIGVAQVKLPSPSDLKN